MTRSVVFTLLVALLWSCGEKQPENVLPPDRMQAVMWDLLQADELSSYYVSLDSAMASAERREGYYSVIYRNHKITREQFRTSFRYYAERPERMKVVLDSLQARSERPEMRDTSIKKPVRNLIKP